MQPIRMTESSQNYLTGGTTTELTSKIRHRDIIVSTSDELRIMPFNGISMSWTHISTTYLMAYVIF